MSKRRTPKKNIKKSEKTAKEEPKKKYTYPKISIFDAVEIIEKVRRKYGADIVPYKVFAKEILGVPKPKGGTYQIKVEALRLYGLMDRHSYREIGILPEGKKILNIDNEEEKMKLMLERVLSVPIIKEVYDRFKSNPPQKKRPIKDFLEKMMNMERGADSLATIIFKDYEIFKPYLQFYFSGALKPDKDEDNKIINLTNLDDASSEKIKALAPVIRLIGSLFPIEEDKNIEKKLNELSKLAKDFKLNTFYGMIEGLRMTKKTTDLNKFSKKIVHTFQDDSGIDIIGKISDKNEESLKKEKKRKIQNEKTETSES